MKSGDDAVHLHVGDALAALEKPRVLLGIPLLRRRYSNEQGGHGPAPKEARHDHLVPLRHAIHHRLIFTHNRVAPHRIGGSAQVRYTARRMKNAVERGR